MQEFCNNEKNDIFEVKFPGATRGAQFYQKGKNFYGN